MFNLSVKQVANKDTNANTVTKNPDEPKFTKVKLIQVNTSNSNWETKRLELLSTIEQNNADICIVSEANADVSNDIKINARNSLFKNYKIELKTVNDQNKARIAMIIRKEIPYTRCADLESKENSSVIIKLSESKVKNTFIVGTYREW